MFGWFKRKAKTPSALFFKSNDAAFEYAAAYMQRPLIKDAVIFGQIVAEAAPEFGSLLRHRQKTWVVRLASEHGVLETSRCGSVAEKLVGEFKLKSLPLREGDLVAVQVGAYDPKYAIDNPMQYFVIMCKLRPEVGIEDHVFLPDVEHAG